MSSRRPTSGAGSAFALGTLIARSRRLMWRTAHRILEGKGQSMMAWQILNCLRRFGSMTQSELALRTGQHPTGLSRMLSTLERDGIVVRSRQEGDHRCVQVRLSEQATARFDQMDPAVEAAAEEVLSALTAEERRTLDALLTKLLAAAGEDPRPS